MNDFGRRRFLSSNAIGLGGLALGQLLASERANPLAPKAPHHPAKAKACIFLTMLGGVSQMDTFDPKPALKKFEGTVMDWSKENVKNDNADLFAKPRIIHGSPFTFQRHGQSGIEVSDLLPHIATCVDDIAVVRSVMAENGAHPLAVFQLNTGFIISGNPSMGAWVTYGLGTENQSLPAFVAMPDYRSIPFNGSQQWGSGFLPSTFQGTEMRWKGEVIRDLAPPADVSNERQERRRDLLRTFNGGFEDDGTNPDLQARIDAYELAYRMQAEVPRVLSIGSEPAHIREMYGIDDPVTESFGKRCLIARKLVESGVRFVQIYTPSQSWDGHSDLVKNHKKNAAETDKPVAALLKDLKQRGLLDSTLVVWMGEFGRTPDTPSDKKDRGRDHNIQAMSMWFAGGGIKGGVCVGQTNDLGYKAVEDVYRIRDVHATILHQMGLSDLRLAHYHAGRNRRLTDTGGKIITQVIA